MLTSNNMSLSRRSFIGSCAAVALAAPAAPVAISKCRTYEPATLVPVLDDMLDKLGGIGRLVKGKTVAIKINCNPNPVYRLGHLPLEATHWPHPKLIGALMHLMARAGAHRVRIVEQAFLASTYPFEEHLLEAGWDPQEFISAAPRVEFENTNYPGAAGQFRRITVPNGGHLFRAYHVNHSYVDCDVFVTITKCRDHPTTGITLGIKNSFGILPTMLYGNGAGPKQDKELAANGRQRILHNGEAQPYDAPAEIDPTTPRHDGYRLPRIVADLAAARPVHLAVLDGITSMAGAHSPDRFCTPVAPGWLVVGTNVVNASAVALAAMNYDPMADRGTVPFENCDNKLRLAEEHGVGTRDPRRIEVIGPPIRELVFDFKRLRAERARRMEEFRRNRASGA